MPLLDSSPYDAIVDTHQRIYKVQIKYTAGVPDERKNSVHIALEGKTNRYNLNNVDFFAVYSEHYQGFFIFPNTGSMKGFRLSLTGKNSIYFNNFAFGS
jgi:hypothetical protein